MRSFCQGAWSELAARETRLPTRADGTHGVLVEIWAARHGAVTVDVAVDTTAGAFPLP